MALVSAVVVSFPFVVVAALVSLGIVAAKATSYFTRRMEGGVVVETFQSANSQKSFSEEPHSIGVRIDVSAEDM